MVPQTLRNIVLNGSDNRPFLLDLQFVETGAAKPILIFCHGFKGFKDWGFWEQVGNYFAKEGFVFAKFNFSHNGTTVEDPHNFGDLEAFGQNNFSKELYDLEVVLDWFHNRNIGLPINEIDLSRIFLIGHSRGGTTVLMKAGEDSRVKKVCTWAAVSDLEKYWPPDTIFKWQEEGVNYVDNARTKQRMPMYWQICQDFLENKSRYDVPSITSNLKIPQLIIHGDEDTAVPLASSEFLKALNPEAELGVIKGANHVFGGSHPWETDGLSEHMQIVCKLTCNFLDA